MQVSELITQLQKYPPETKVRFWFPVMENYHEGIFDIQESPRIGTIAPKSIDVYIRMDISNLIS